MITFTTIIYAPADLFIFLAFMDPLSAQLILDLVSDQGCNLRHKSEENVLNFAKTLKCI